MEELLKEKYYILLYEYLFKETSLTNYDNNFSSSDLKYEKTSEEEKDEYQKKSILNYFYIRNDFHLENLESDKKLLLDKIDSETTYDVKKEFINSTLSDVLTDKSVSENNLIPYGPIADYNCMAKNGTLVIGFRYDEFFGYDDMDDSWSDNLDLQEDEIYEVLPKIEQEIAEKIKIPVKIIQYNENTVELDNGPKM
ncbi:MAG: hypothetical protein J6O62_00035 [Bacilli bacterium]|nr:hypothetical protein [Bacilli bacterium]